MKYKNFIKEFRKEYKKNKLKFSIYFILRGLVILCLILQLLNGEFENAALCFLSLILLLLPFLYPPLSSRTSLVESLTRSYYNTTWHFNI